MTFTKSIMELIKSFRLFIVQLLLNTAFEVCPNSGEKIILADCVLKYTTKTFPDINHSDLKKYSEALKMNPNYEAIKHAKQVLDE